jgi:hypothetical protein
MKSYTLCIKNLAMLSLILSHCSSYAQGAGIPTFDVASYLQALRTIQQQAQMLTQLQDQINNQLLQIEAITKTRDLKELLGIKDIENLIDPAALAAVKNLENSGISEVGIKNAKLNHAVALRTAERLQKRKLEISQMMEAASKTVDAKTSADLSARASALNASLLNEMLFQQELQKASIAKTIWDEYQLRQQSFDHFAAGKTNPFQIKRP